MRSFEDYCGAGLLVLLILTVFFLLIDLIPVKVWILVGCLFLAIGALTFLCYGLGRLAYFIMDKLQ